MPVTWTAEGDFSDIRYELDGAGIAKITIARPEVRNAFRPQTVVELSRAFERAREDPHVGVIVLTGEGEDAFCSGAGCPSRSSPWSPATPWEADTCSTSAAI